MQRNDPVGAVELPSFTAQTNSNLPALSITLQDLTADPSLQAEAKMALPALVLSVDQEDEICLKKGNSPQQLRRKAAWLSKPYFFNLLPQDVQEKLVDYGAERPLVHLCLFPQALDLKVATNEVLLAILQGDLPKAKAMVQQRPELLTRKGRARVCPGRAYKDITPLQAALCARNDKMSAMLKAYMQPQEIERQ